ncbi:MAG TPA: DUF167 domain-containing protein [Methanoregulaceae archaeon]|nr:DUF167 domain-containing protein [Methanoregulaceae archaeon]HOV68283.1 DUF167 domain-containing protein [Methanoregulaceae archaeon]HQJ86948.1 DUF167 domain-containing protein [Methanoregulaceae archaeon]
MDLSGALSPHPDGCLIALEVSPNARRSRFPDGFNPWRRTIGCAITAPPVEGRANRAVIELVAATLGVKRAQVEVISGGTSSLKRILVRGKSPGDLLPLLRIRDDDEEQR